MINLVTEKVKKSGQTDFGRIYFKKPRLTQNPKTVQELAWILKTHNQAGRRVAIRNTGHSVNGQTLTDGVQVNIGGIKGIGVDRRKGEVEVGAGTTWHEMLEAIGFPEFCPPVFPNNPGQKIKIGGTVAVGGVGPYSIRNGGLWNHILGLTVVTMTGEIIECSPTENSEIFYYSLGGFGRIGVAARIKMKIEKSVDRVATLAMVYHNEHDYLDDLNLASYDPMVSGMIAQEQIRHRWWSPFNIFKGILVAIELQDGERPADKLSALKQKYNPDFILGIKKGRGYNVDAALGPEEMKKRDIVYFYPENYHDDNMAHPWSDYLITRDKYPDFIKAVKKELVSSGLSKYILRESIWNGLTHLDALPTYAVKNLKGDFPLAFDVARDDDFYFGVGVMPAVPPSMIPKAKEATKKLTELVYEMGGKRYLYGVHDLTEDQVEKQFGRETIENWNRLKDELDPKHLLNIGVIERLD